MLFFKTISANAERTHSPDTLLFCLSLSLASHKQHSRATACFNPGVGRGTKEKARKSKGARRKQLQRKRVRRRREGKLEEGKKERSPSQGVRRYISSPLSSAGQKGCGAGEERMEQGERRDKRRREEI